MTNSALWLVAQCPFWHHLWLFVRPFLVMGILLPAILVLANAGDWVERQDSEGWKLVKAITLVVAVAGVLFLAGAGLVAWWAEACK